MAEDFKDQQLARWANGELSEEELKEHFAREDLLKFRQILDEVDSWTPGLETDVFSADAVTRQQKQGKVRRLWLPLSVAASVLMILAAGIWFINLPGQVTHTTVAGETREILLPDGQSTITLAANSSVSWTDESWSATQRQLTLEGKGFLQVEEGSPFTVTTSTGKVEVLGTRFEVHEFESGMQVSCYQGRVKATAANQPSVIVNGGEGHLYYQGQWEAKKEVSGAGPQWLNNESSFENAPLRQVIKTLESEYGLKTDAGAVNLSRRFTGSFPNNNLDEALRLVFIPLSINYELKDDRLYLSE
ncbi:MAG: FecR domain-containing protein [Imperialibacter sp.]|uniref:FecR family protein n=1 Tax=Imperialibacter sp. TaxID=2038411 RepID=UPI0032F01B2C